jgi:hypothetical protein
VICYRVKASTHRTIVSWEPKLKFNEGTQMNKFLSALIAIAFSAASLQVMAADAPAADAAKAEAAAPAKKCGDKKEATAKKTKHHKKTKKAAAKKCGDKKEAAPAEGAAK